MPIEYLILFCLGSAFGVIFRAIWDDRKKVTGVVQIDHNSGLCRFCVTNEQLSNPKCKKVVFIIEHDAVITDDDYVNSQEKQGL